VTTRAAITTETEGLTMQKMSLDALAREHLERARESSPKRSMETVYGRGAADGRQD
jgi:hypothetical protein